MIKCIILAFCFLGLFCPSFVSNWESKFYLQSTFKIKGLLSKTINDNNDKMNKTRGVSRKSRNYTNSHFLHNNNTTADLSVSKDQQFTKAWRSTFVFRLDLNIVTVDEVTREIIPES